MLIEEHPEKISWSRHWNSHFRIISSFDTLCWHFLIMILLKLVSTNLVAILLETLLSIFGTESRHWKRKKKKKSNYKSIISYIFLAIDMVISYFLYLQSPLRCIWASSQTKLKYSFQKKISEEVSLSFGLRVWHFTILIACQRHTNSW